MLTAFFLGFVLRSDMYELCFVFINCALIPFLDSALWLVAEVRIYSLSSQFLLRVLIPMLCMI